MKHTENCRYRRAVLGETQTVNCKHGFLGCPICDKCDCEVYEGAMTAEQENAIRETLGKLVRIHDDDSSHPKNFDKCECGLAQGIRNVCEWLEKVKSSMGEP